MLPDSMRKREKFQGTAHVLGWKGASSCQGLCLPCPVQGFSAMGRILLPSSVPREQWKLGARGCCLWDVFTHFYRRGFWSTGSLGNIYWSKVIGVPQGVIQGTHYMEILRTRDSALNYNGQLELFFLNVFTVGKNKYCMNSSIFQAWT